MAVYKDGEVIRYPYLWLRQAGSGETVGRKDRPVCVAVAMQRQGLTHVFLVAITSTEPQPDQNAIELPEIEARRAQLRTWKKGWVIVDEYNYDVLERSFFLESSQKPIGRFSEAFTKRIKAALRQLLKNGELGRVNRTE